MGVLLLAGGHAWAAPPPDGATKPAADVCVPPGFPPFALWQRGPAELNITEDERGRPVLIVKRIYRAGGQIVHTAWVGAMLALVDAAPDDPLEPSWRDLGVVADGLIVRATPSQTCQWTKPPRREERPQEET